MSEKVRPGDAGGGRLSASPPACPLCRDGYREDTNACCRCPAGRKRAENYRHSLEREAWWNCIRRSWIPRPENPTEEPEPIGKIIPGLDIPKPK